MVETALPDVRMDGHHPDQPRPGQGQHEGDDQGEPARIFEGRPHRGPERLDRSCARGLADQRLAGLGEAVEQPGGRGEEGHQDGVRRDEGRTLPRGECREDHEGRLQQAGTQEPVS